MKHVFTFMLFLTSAVMLNAQSLYQGPAAGAVDSGVVLNTNSFLESSVAAPGPLRSYNKIPYTEPFIAPVQEGKVTPRLYVTDLSTEKAALDTGVQPVVIKSFTGIPRTNSIPPDPYVAVGPNHILATVNTAFAVWDKNGNKLKQIEAGTFYNRLIPGVNIFDPKVIYDHFANRWVMVWLDQDDNAFRGNIVISVSDDDNPLGVWYNWALPSGWNGTVNDGTWSDYQGVGYDKDAIYVTSNQFQFGGSFQYAKIRIIPKAQLLLGAAGRVTWFDLYNIRYPHQLTTGIFNVRPSRSYAPAGGDYFLAHAPQGGGNFISVYKIQNAATAPVMTGTSIAVATFQAPPQANQLGGSTTLLESGNAAIRNEPVYRDNKLWIVHNILNNQFPSFSMLRYMQVNTQSMTLAEDIAYGADQYYYFYSGLAVDKYDNIGFTFSRSATTEYVGAYFTAKYKNSATMIAARPMQTGKGNYVVVGSNRNRWGDYNGIWLDPVTETNMWMFTEYAAAKNQWGTWNTETRLVPYDNVKIFTTTPSLDFIPTEVGTKSDTLTAVIMNYGSTTFTIDSIKTKTNQFSVISPVSLPYALKTYDTLKVKIVHKPTAAGSQPDTLRFTGNSGDFKGLPVTAKGYVVVAAAEKQVYGISATGQTLKIDKATGAGTLVAPSNFSSIISTAIHPKTKVMYGLRVNALNNTDILRFNITLGEAFVWKTLPGSDFTAIAFDTSATAFIARRGGSIYKLNLDSLKLTYVDSCVTTLASLAFHPKTNQLWASLYRAIGSGKDYIVKIKIPSGDTSLVGATGHSTITNAIFFDEKSNLYGVKGFSTTPSDFMRIDTATGEGTVLGTVGFNGLTALGYYAKTITGVRQEGTEMPASFTLSQNYPNPFNPETRISYGIPVDASVRLSVYTVLGEKIADLSFGAQKAGAYSVSLGSSVFGKLGSGIYFYELSAEHAGGVYSDIKKLNLVK